MIVLHIREIYCLFKGTKKKKENGKVDVEKYRVIYLLSYKQFKLVSNNETKRQRDRDRFCLILFF